MWEINNTVQVTDFLRAIIFGIIICAFYGIFASLRKNGVDSNFAVLLEDVIFFIILSPLIFLFLLSTTNGELRLYIIIGILVGFYIFKIALFKIWVFMIYKTNSVIIFCFRFLRGVFLKTAYLITKISKKIGKKLFFLKKAVNSLKKGLKK